MVCDGVLMFFFGSCGGVCWECDLVYFWWEK